MNSSTYGNYVPRRAVWYGKSPRRRSTMVTFALLFALSASLIFPLLGHVEFYRPEIFHFLGLSVLFLTCLACAWFDVPVMMVFLLSSLIGGAILISAEMSLTSFYEYPIILLFFLMLIAVFHLRETRFTILFLFIFLIQITVMYFLPSIASVVVPTHEAAITDIFSYGLLGVVMYFISNQTNTTKSKSEKSFSVSTDNRRNFSDLLSLDLCYHVTKLRDTIDDKAKKGFGPGEVRELQKLAHHIYRNKKDILEVDDFAIEDIELFNNYNCVKHHVETGASSTLSYFIEKHSLVQFETSLSKETAYFDGYRLQQLIRTALLLFSEGHQLCEIVFTSSGIEDKSNLLLTLRFEKSIQNLGSDQEEISRISGASTELDFYRDFLNKLVESFSGRMSYSSDDDTKKRTMEIALNLPRYSPEHTPDNDPLYFRPKTVLIADDDLVLQLLFEKLFENRSERAIMTPNGQVCLDYYKENHESIDLVCLDCNMPVLDGYKTAEKIREFQEEKGLKKIPILAISGNIGTDKIIQCFESGMDYFLAKPFHTQELFEIIEKITESRCQLL